MTRPRFAALALAVAAGAGAGCAHSVASGPGSPPEARPAAPRACAIRAEALLAEPATGVDLGAVLEARLRARGAGDVVRTDAPAAGQARLELYLVASRMTPLTRWTGFPWILVFMGSLGMVPYRDGQEHVVELHAVLPDAPAARRVRIARRSYVVATWSWLPFAFRRAPEGGSAGELRRVHEEGLARAVDAALDEVLAADAPRASASATPPGR